MGLMDKFVPAGPWNLWEHPALLLQSAYAAKAGSLQDSGLTTVKGICESPSSVQYADHSLEFGAVRDFFIRMRIDPTKSQYNRSLMETYEAHESVLSCGRPLNERQELWEDPLHLQLGRLFFSREQGILENPGWVSRIDCRVPSISRLNKDGMYLREDKSNCVIARHEDVREGMRFPLRIVGGEFALCGSFLSPTWATGRNPSLVCRYRCRSLNNAFGERLPVPESVDYQWYFPDVVVENDLGEEGLMQVDGASPMYHHLRMNESLGIHLFTTVTLVLAKIVSGLECWNGLGGPMVQQLLITIDSKSLRTVVVTEGSRPLVTYCLQYPEEHELLKRAVTKILRRCSE